MVAGTSSASVSCSPSHTKAVATTGGVNVSGTVSSPDNGCERNRRVKVYHDVAPPYRDFKLGTVTTNNSGLWQLSSNKYPDQVYAKVKRTENCKKDKSPTVPVT